MTGAAQNFARKYTIPIDDVVFDFAMMSEERYSAGPPNGVYTYGLFVEGARWEKSEKRLTESMPKVLFTLAPTMHWQPFRKAEVPQYPHYKCPVYKTSDRRYVRLLQFRCCFVLIRLLFVYSGILATTGHSSNFVCFIHMPSDMEEAHWVQRGVAMLTQLDN